jgi:hypothetical protein
MSAPPLRAITRVVPASHTALIEVGIVRCQQNRVVPRRLFTPRPCQGEGFFVPFSGPKERSGNGGIY